MKITIDEFYTLQSARALRLVNTVRNQFGLTETYIFEKDDECWCIALNMDPESGLPLLSTRILEAVKVRGKPIVKTLWVRESDGKIIGDTDAKENDYKFMIWQDMCRLPGEIGERCTRYAFLVGIPSDVLTEKEKEEKENLLAYFKQVLRFDPGWE